MDGGRLLELLILGKSCQEKAPCLGSAGGECRQPVTGQEQTVQTASPYIDWHSGSGHRESLIIDNQ